MITVEIWEKSDFGQRVLGLVRRGIRYRDAIDQATKSTREQVFYLVREQSFREYVKDPTKNFFKVSVSKDQMSYIPDAFWNFFVDGLKGDFSEHGGWAMVEKPFVGEKEVIFSLKRDSFKRG